MEPATPFRDRTTTRSHRKKSEPPTEDLIPEIIAVEAFAYAATQAARSYGAPRAITDAQRLALGRLNVLVSAAASAASELHSRALGHTAVKHR